MSEYQDDFTDLLGAYALDAVDPDERERIELHLVDCPRCRAEVAEHREVAALLSQSGAPAPDGVWDRIAAELSPPAPPMRMTISPTGEATPAAPVAPAPPAADPDVVPIGDAPSRRRGIQTRTMAALLGVAACLVMILGAVVVVQGQRDRNQTVEELASQAAEDSKLKVDLTGEGGAAQAVVGANGQGYLIMDEAAVPAEGDVNQLWGVVDGTTLSLGTFGDSSVVPFSVDADRIGDIEAFAVTQEKAPGVPSSENPAVMIGTV